MIRDPDRLADDLQRLLPKIAARAPGGQAIVAVAEGDGEFRWTGAIGPRVADGPPVRGDTPFFLASIDKLLNAVMALRLCESGRLDLDASIAAYLPDGLVRGLHGSGRDDRSGQVTVRHLLAHASGLADWLEDRPRGGTSLVDAVLERGDRALTMEEIADIVRGLAPHFPPQDLAGPRPRVRYSDTNFMLLIAILERVSGMPLHRLAEAMLFRPLGLNHSYYPGLSAPRASTPDPAALRAGGRAIEIPAFLRSIRGLYASADDAIRLLRKLMRNEVFDDPATLAALTGDWHRFGLPRDRAALRAPGWPIDYGLGMMRFRLPRLFSPLRPMPEVVGHTGSTGCWLFFCPKLDLYLAGSVDEVTSGAVPYRVVPDILRLCAARAWA